MRTSTVFLAVLLLGRALAAEPAAAPTPKPQTRTVNPNATQAARQLLDFLYEIQGRYTLSGQHNFIAVGSRYTDLTRELTGRTPIVWGSDFSFAYRGDAPQQFQHCGPLNLPEPGTGTQITDLSPKRARQQLMLNVIEACRKGHIVTLMWHACPPQVGGDMCDGKAIWTLERRPSQEEWDRLTTDGTELNAAWKKQADVIAGYLKQLKDAGVPVLWRPYHEMNGVWFWWCNKKGENGFKKLWVMMFDYFVKHHQLDNLIWVWNTNAPRDRPNDEAYAYQDFWPGLEYVDVLAADVYREDWKQSHHDDLVTLAHGKPIALGEVGSAPSSETLAAQSHWTWYMPWGKFALQDQALERLKTLLQDDRILTRDDVTRDEHGNYRITRKDAGRE
jgi:mannan endo-1,4-beta-mannosidase